jgi:hypothetical protein
MVPPPSAVMQPSRQTPTQSMLRLPAASAAVIACAASATIDSTCSTVSLGGRPHIATSRQASQNQESWIRDSRMDWNLRRGFHSEQIENARRPPIDFRWRPVGPFQKERIVPGTSAAAHC